MIKFCRKLHNWLGLLLVVQVMLWFLSGLTMAILPIEEVRGEHLRQTPTANWQQARISPQQVLQPYSQGAKLSLTQRITDNGPEPVFQIEDNDSIQRYSAVSGEQLQPLDESQIRIAAQLQYRGDGNISSAQLLHTLPQEVRQLIAPLWQLHYNDANGTVLYLDPDSGSVVRVRTDNWRLFDFFWMLHIMDYDTRHNFNNPLLISFSALALLFTFTGIVLLWQRYKPKRRVNRQAKQATF